MAGVFKPSQIPEDNFGGPTAGGLIGGVIGSMTGLLIAVTAFVAPGGASLVSGSTVAGWAFVGMILGAVGGAIISALVDTQMS